MQYLPSRAPAWKLPHTLKGTVKPQQEVEQQPNRWTLLRTQMVGLKTHSLKVGLHHKNFCCECFTLQPSTSNSPCHLPKLSWVLVTSGSTIVLPLPLDHGHHHDLKHHHHLDHHHDLEHHHDNDLPSLCSAGIALGGIPSGSGSRLWLPGSTGEKSSPTLEEKGLNYGKVKFVLLWTCLSTSCCFRWP